MLKKFKDELLRRDLQHSNLPSDKDFISIELVCKHLLNGNWNRCADLYIQHGKNYFREEVNTATIAGINTFLNDLMKGGKNG